MTPNVNRSTELAWQHRNLTSSAESLAAWKQMKVKEEFFL
jgi:hypothetical protein